MKENNQELRASEVSLRYKNRIPISKRVQIKDSSDAYHVFRDSWNVHEIDHHETVKVLLLNNKHHVLGIAEVSNGGITSSLVDVRIVMQLALKSHATGIILCHSHPSGDPMPSESDVTITKKLMQAGEVVNIQVLDHIVICSDGYISLGDEGRL